MAFYIQLLWWPELMGIYLVSSKMRCRFMTFGCLLCGDVFVVWEGFASNCDLQTFLRIKLMLESSNNRRVILQSNIWRIHSVCLAVRWKHPLFSRRNFPEVFLLNFGMLTGWSMSPVQRNIHSMSISVCAIWLSYKKTQDIKSSLSTKLTSCILAQISMVQGL